MKKAYLYCDKRSLNDATNYYVNIIKECIIECGYQFYITHNQSEIKSPNLILTLTEKFYFLAKMRFPFVNTIYWAQGVSAEELKLNGIKTLKNKIKFIFKYITENIAVNTSNILFVVSEKMLNFYSTKYRYDIKKNNYVIMPCFNLELSKYFNISQYKYPTFVYAGSASSWQCVDKMLIVYSLLEKNMKDTKMVILSADKEIFENYVKKYNIKNYEIKYIPQKELNNELHKYKYGFLLREDHIVNNVATPTKMNSYLSNYVIPIYSNAVEDFVKNIKMDEFSIVTKCPLDETEICNQIFEFEMSKHDYSELKIKIENIFEKHYNKEKYKNIIQSKFISFGL